MWNAVHVHILHMSEEGLVDVLEKFSSNDPSFPRSMTAERLLRGNLTNSFYQKGQVVTYVDSVIAIIVAAVYDFVFPPTLSVAQKQGNKKKKKKKKKKNFALQSHSNH